MLSKPAGPPHIDWGDRELDIGRYRQWEIAEMQILGMNTDGAYPRASSFMSHGILAGRIRQNDYRAFLLTQYPLYCYTMASDSRYLFGNTMLPGGYPGDISPCAWAAVVNSEQQIALGSGRFPCYEEQNRNAVRLQKAAPKRWFAPGESIRLGNCPTRFGHIDWTNEAAAGARGGWHVALQLEKPSRADLILHIHPPDDQPLRSASLGHVQRTSAVLPSSLLDDRTQLAIDVS